MKNFFVTSLLLIILFCANAFAAEPASKQEQEDISTREYLGAMFAVRENNFEEAAHLFQEALWDNPGDPFLVESTFKFMLISGNYPKAVKYAAEYLEYDKNSLSALLLLAVNAVKEGNFYSAADILRGIQPTTDGKIVSIEQLLLPFIKIWVVAGQGNHDLALNMLEDYNTSDVVSKEFIILQKALLLNLSGDKEGAEQHFSLLKNSKGLMPYHLAKSMAGFYESIGKWEDAGQIYHRYRIQHPAAPNFENSETRVRNKIYSGLYITNAKDGFNEVIKEAARLLLRGKAYNEGLVYVRFALLLKPTDEEALIMLANFYEENGEWQKAIDLYDRINKDSDLYTSSQINKAEDFYRAGDKKEAKKLLLSIAEDTKDKYVPLVTLADLYRRDNNHKEAAKIYTKVLEIINQKNPASWSIFFARGIAYERLKEWEKAEQDFLTSLKINPEQPEVINYLAYSWIERNQNLEKARDMLLKAVVMRPDDPQILDSAGWALYKMKDYKNAVMFLERATEILPQDSTINDHLGDVYWRLGRRYEAVYTWQRSLKYGKSESSSLDEINKKIEKGSDK